MRRAGWMAGIACVFLCDVAAAQTLEFSLDPEPAQYWYSDTELVVSIGPQPGATQPAYVYREASRRRHWLMEDAGQRWFGVELQRGTWTMNGELTADAAAEALIGKPVEIAFDERGRLVDLRGLEGAAEALGAAGPQDMDWTSVLRSKYTAMWDATLGVIWDVLAGRQAVIGDSWADSRRLQVLRFPYQIGKVPAGGEWTFVGRKTPAADSAAELRYVYQGETESLSEEAVTAITAWLAERVPQVAPQPWSSVSVRNDGDLTIDPTTLVTMQWTDRMRLVVQTDDPTGAPVEVTIELQFTLGT